MERLKIKKLQKKYPGKKPGIENPQMDLKNALIASESRYRRLFETAKDGILILDAETGMIEDVNPFLIDLLGFSKEKILKKAVWEIGFFRNIIENHEKFLELQQKGYVRYENLPLETTSGKAIHVEFVSNVYTENKHKVIQCNIRDITQRKTAEQELIQSKLKAEESDRLKTAFLSNMSHEIRTPMNGILGFTELLKTPKLNGEKQKNYIEVIEKSGSRLLNIINNIISISKVESGFMDLTVSSTNINDQCNFIYNFFNQEVTRKGIKLIFSSCLPENEAIINTDREKVYSILTNLVKNAIKFTNSGSIEFGYILKRKSSSGSTTNIKNSELEFFVKDTGTGILPEQKEFIFDRFRQGTDSYNRNYEGTGLGLAISKAYAEMLGGNIWVECNSEMPLIPGSEANGSTFYFTIPYNQDMEKKLKADIIKPEDVEKEYPDKKLKILVVEDDEMSNKLLSIIIRKYDKGFLNAENGIEAVESSRNNPDINLILMDIEMPKMNGYEAVRQIRRFNKKVYIIAQTAYGLEGDREKAIEAGCNDHISKPIDQFVLRKKINEHFYSTKNVPSLQS